MTDEESFYYTKVTFNKVKYRNKYQQVVQKHDRKQTDSNIITSN